jgi:small subunit ribosomal protein S4
MTVKTKTLRKHCRALGVNLIGTPNVALTLNRRPNRPGQHGAARRGKLSPYALQLMETQKLKHFYGVTAKQLRRYYERASKSREQTNVMMVQLMERRLDNMVYRMGFTPTLRAARQMVVHRHILVNGKNVNKPSMELRAGDVVQLREKSRSVERYKDWFELYEQQLGYVERDPSQLSGKLVAIPSRDEIPIQVEDNLVVEFMAL